MASWSSCNVLPAVALVIIGILLAYSDVGDAVPCMCGASAAAADPPIDPCPQVGLYRSTTTLRASTSTPMKPLLPYDYYECVPYGNTFIRYTQRCSSHYIFYKETAGGPELYFNLFEDATKNCSRKLPAGAVIVDCEIPTMCA